MTALCATPGRGSAAKVSAFPWVGELRATANIYIYIWSSRRILKNEVSPFIWSSRRILKNEVSPFSLGKALSIGTFLLKFRAKMTPQRRSKAIDDYSSKFDWPGINPLWGHCQEYKMEKKSNPTRASFIRKKKRFRLLQPYLVWKFLSHWSRKTSPKVRDTLKSLPKVVSKRSRQEECVQSAKTAKSFASCVASQVLQVIDKPPSFPRKAEFSQIER